MKTSKYITVSLHVLIWLVLLLLPYLISHRSDNYKLGEIPGIFVTTCDMIHIGVFYGNALYLYPKWCNRRQWYWYILSSIGLILLSIKLKFFIIDGWFPELMADKSIYRFVVTPSFVMFFISLIYRRVVDGIRFEKLQKERQAAQLATELKFLRSQISPHFLFNVLTNLVSLARKGSTRLEPSLIMLADLMRYMLYDAQGKKVELRKEVDYLHNYIELQKLRFGSDISIDCTIHVGSEDEQLDIEPMLLIPFVENAFKHGTASSGDLPRIHIDLSVFQGVLRFDVQNNFDPEEHTGEDENSGIGLNNVKTRLQLLYENNYTLKINEDNDLFHVTLNLQLI
jgi:hypothetical protein